MINPPSAQRKSRKSKIWRHYDHLSHSVWCASTHGTVLFPKFKHFHTLPHPRTNQNSSGSGKRDKNMDEHELNRTGLERTGTDINWTLSIFSFWYYSTPRIWSSFFDCPYPYISPPPHTPACSHIHAINERKNAKELQKSCRKTQKTRVE